MTSRDETIELMQSLAKTSAAEDQDPLSAYSRRSFLKGGVATAAAMAMPFGMLGSGAARAVTLPFHPDYGPLAPVNDEATGLPLLQLPAGFKYWSFGWTGDPMSDGVATPGVHDGMAVVEARHHKLTLIRNHEQGGATGSFARRNATFDPAANGGCTNLVFNTRTKELEKSWASISGTLRNCAGGPTPWESWLTCEETSNGPHTVVSGATPFTEQHGWVFDVPADGHSKADPLKGLGAFSHEACAIDPKTGIVYETEDSTPSGFYRFIPERPGHLNQGGRLQMMKLIAQPNASITLDGTAYSYFNTGAAGVPNGTTWLAAWVDIEDPEAMFLPGTLTYGGVRAQGLKQGASSIVRGEGCWYGNGVIYVCSTSGGAAGQGQIFAYDPRREIFTLVYESTAGNVLDHPDNIAVSPRGSLILCEDGSGVEYLHGLTLDGKVFKFCANNVNFPAGGYARSSGRTFTGDATGSEFCGATFHDDWLFVNIQSPGITFAITGPWENGPL